jgi:hypothetical protein
MANKQILMNEIETLPVSYIDEILHYVRSFKQAKQQETSKQSETPLTDSLIGILEGTGITCVNDIKDMRLAEWL